MSEADDEYFATMHPRVRSAPTTHVYVSTACQHSRHSDCRLNCKFCDAACGCHCHQYGLI